MSKWVHRLKCVDGEWACAECGPITPVYHHGRATCPVAKRLQRGTNKNNYVSPETRRQMMTEQNDRCAICGCTGALVVDHDHATLKIRGLLCNNCNVGLGFFKDSTQLLNKAKQYLDRQQPPLT